MRKSEKTDFHDILAYIEQADDFEINQIIAVVNKRFQIQFPDWDVLYISCPKNDPTERERTLAYINEYFQNSHGNLNQCVDLECSIP